MRLSVNPRAIKHFDKLQVGEKFQRHTHKYKNEVWIKVDKNFALELSGMISKVRINEEVMRVALMYEE